MMPKGCSASMLQVTNVAAFMEKSFKAWQGRMNSAKVEKRRLGCC